MEELGFMEEYNNGIVSFVISEVNNKKEDVSYFCETTHDIFHDSFMMVSNTSIRSEPKVPTLISNCSFEIDKQTLCKITNRGEHFSVVCKNKTLVFTNGPDDDEWSTEPIKIDSAEGAESVILDGYLPPWGWLEVGAYLRVNFVNLVDRTEYRAQNGFSIVLPHVSGYVNV